MLSFTIIWLLILCRENSSVIRFSVPEDHYLTLPCSDPDVVWTHRDREMAVRPLGAAGGRSLLLPGGELRLLRLEESDSGEYRCNERLEAELQVLTGSDFMVFAGRTLLLPCSSNKPMKRWFFQPRDGGKQEILLTWFKNGTAAPAGAGGGLGLGHGALQINGLQPRHAGEYRCNRRTLARVSVLTVKPEPTNLHQTSSTTTVMKTDVVDVKKKKRRPENVLLQVFVFGFAVMVAVCVLLTSVSCRKKCSRTAKVRSHEDTELQPSKTPDTQTECGVDELEETIIYASLGRNEWKERPNRKEKNDHGVIYSSVITTNTH